MPEEPFHFSPDSQIIKQTERSSLISRLVKAAIVHTTITVVTCLIVYWYIVSNNEPPHDFPINEPITIEQGTSVRAITEFFKEQNVVRSSTLLYYALALFYDPTDIKASSYLFDTPLSTFEIAERLTQGDFDTDLVRFTHFEGERVSLLAKRASESLPNFNAERFLLAAEPLEGKLFPDTYFVPASFSDEELLELMQSTFAAKITDREEQIIESELTLDEILTLASIVEREANTTESKQQVASILLNRLSIGMALQADASIEYILDKPLSELTSEDLKIDSPYNTYLNPGLPPTPIGNPGLEAIDAVLNPIESEYFYYITDDDGEFYYSKTYSEHLKNIELYLR